MTELRTKAGRDLWAWFEGTPALASPVFRDRILAIEAEAAGDWAKLARDATEDVHDEGHGGDFQRCEIGLCWTFHHLAGQAMERAG
jgi:hypothetical protein